MIAHASLPKNQNIKQKQYCKKKKKKVNKNVKNSTLKKYFLKKQGIGPWGKARVPLIGREGYKNSG